MEKILVTGILGFIGFHSAKKLKERNYDVIGFDNLNDYYDIKWKILRLKKLQELGIPIFFQDLKDLDSMKNCLEILRPDKILHLAAQAGVRYSLTNPDSYMQSNCLGFYNLLESVKSLKIPVVYASSSSVYGSNTKIPFSESDPTDSPMSLYAATKKSNEVFAQSYHENYQIPLIGLRFFTVYGPYGRPDMAYFSFAEKILNNQPITVYSKGMLKRDFTYIDDIVFGILRALEFPVRCGIFNLGNNTPCSVNELVAILEKNLQKKAVVIDQEAPSADVPITYADIEKSRSVLGYEPKVSLSDGIHQFVNWYTQSFDHLPNSDEVKKLHQEFSQSNYLQLMNKP